MYVYVCILSYLCFRDLEIGQAYLEVGSSRWKYFGCQIFIKNYEARQWWRMPALGRQSQVDLCEFKVSLVYKR